MSNPNSKEEFFIPITNDKTRTPERLYRNKRRDSETEPIIIPTKNKNRSLSAPTIPPNIDGVIEPKGKYESEEDLKRHVTLEQRKKAFSSDALNEYAFPTLDTNQPTESKMGQPTESETKKRQARLLRSDDRRRKSALTLLMEQKEENEGMSAEDKKGGKRRKTRKSTKSKKRRTKK